MIRQFLKHTLRVQFTLIGVKENTLLVSTLIHLGLMDVPINSVQAMRGKEGIFMGYVETYDAFNNRLLKAYVEKQYLLMGRFIFKSVEIYCFAYMIVYVYIKKEGLD